MLRPHALMFLACLAIPAMAQEPQPRQLSTPPPPAGDRLLVCNKAEDTLSIFAVAQRKELAVLKTGQGPHEVAVSPNGRTAVVTDYGNQKPGHTLTVVDVVLAKVLRTIDLSQLREEAGSDNKKFLRPHGVQFVSDVQVVVTSEAARRLVRVNVQTGKVEQTWRTGQPTMHMVSATRDGALAAATSVVDGTVVFFDLANKDTQVAKSIKTGEGAEGLAVDPITGDAWVGNRDSNTLSIVSRKTGNIEKTLTTGTLPFRVAFTPDGKHVLVTCAESGELQVFDAQERKLAHEVSIHGDRSEQSSLPLGVVSGPDARFAYVACARGEFVAVIDLKSAQYIDRIDTRKGPDGIGYARPVAAPNVRDPKAKDTSGATRD